MYRTGVAKIERKKIEGSGSKDAHDALPFVSDIARGFDEVMKLQNNVRIS